MTTLQSWVAMIFAMARDIREEEGQTMAEYGLLLAFIGIVVLVGVTLLGTNLLARFNAIAGALAP